MMIGGLRVIRESRVSYSASRAASWGCVLLTLGLFVVGCSDAPAEPDGGAGDSATPVDSGAPPLDAAPDSGPPPADGAVDSGDGPDAGADSGTPPPAGDHPVLYRFRVEADEADRVYFASTEAITATTTAGFTISGKTIAGVAINDGALDGHYFTVSAPFTYWDNNTIRYEGGSDLADLASNALYEFTLRYIENHLPEPGATESTYYVNAAVAASGDGSSEGEAFRTIGEAAGLAAPGTTIWVKAGDYGNEQVVLAASGTATAPVKLVGYRDTPGDHPSLPRSLGMAFDSAVMPLLSGGGRAAGITADNRYTIIRNMQVEEYADLIMAQGRNLLFSVLDNVYLQDGDNGLYVNDNDSQNVRVINSYIANCSSKGIRVQNKHNLIDNVWSVSTRVVNEDYYFSIYGGVEGGNNIVRNSYVRRFRDDSHTGHGIVLKGGSPTFTHEYNLIEDCEVINSENGAIEFRHSEVTHSVARGINIHQESPDHSAYGTVGISFENGASFNTVENCSISARAAFMFIDSEEDGSATEPGGDDNTIINTVVYGSRYAVSVRSTNPNTNNRFIGCTFHDNDYLIYQQEDPPADMLGPTNEFTSCSISTSPTFLLNGSPEPTFSGNNFHDAWGTEGSSASTDDPRYVDVAAGDFTPTNAAFQRAPAVPEVRYDMEGRERAAPFTIGAFEMP